MTVLTVSCTEISEDGTNSLPIVNENLENSSPQEDTNENSDSVSETCDSFSEDTDEDEEFDDLDSEID